MGLNVGHLVLSAAVAMLALPACTPAEEGAFGDFQSDQQQSYLGPTSEWKLTTGFWADSMQSMRDRAYQHCNEKPGDAAACFDWQDWSLVAAMNIDSDVAAVRRGRSGALPSLFLPQFEQSIRDMPEVFDEARKQCFDIYRDGDGDARSLGPCLCAAAGRDYFRIVPVP